MNVLVYLVPMALGLGLLGLFAFLWALRSGQYSDVDGAAQRVLSDDDLKSRLIPCPGTLNFPSQSWPGYFCRAIYAARSAASPRDRLISGMRGCGASKK